MILAAISQAPVASPDPLPIKDIVPPLPLPYATWMIVAAALAAVLLLVGMVALVRYYLKRRPPPAPPTARALALRRLEQLRPQVRTLETYAFSIAVSDVLRSYIGSQFGLRTSTQTSPEFLASIATNPVFLEDDRHLLAEFLGRSDLIKFAHIEAGEEDSARLLESASRFVSGGRA